MKQSPRVLRLQQEYAQMLGGYDADNRMWPYDEAKQKQHLFAIKNHEQEESHWTFVLGHMIIGAIRADIYDIEYIGLHRHFCPPGRTPKTKEQKDMMKKVSRFLKKQETDLAYGKKMAAERQGIYEDEAEESADDESETSINEKE